MADKKQRLDRLLFERGLAESRSRAQALILAGRVVVGDHRVDKAGTRVFTDAEIRVKGPDHLYVSRGGVKLKGALEEFSLTVSGLVALDVGASTGGFCDCLLQRGVKHVYALDVGRGQLHDKLRRDPRVTSIERVNVRKLKADALPQKVDLAVMDLSFISLKLALPPILPHLKKGARILALVKPQFEVGLGQVGKGGIVRDEKLREEAVDGIAEFAQSLGLVVAGRCRSSIQGAAGNVEYFLLLVYVA